MAIPKPVIVAIRDRIRKQKIILTRAKSLAQAGQLSVVRGMYQREFVPLQKEKEQLWLRARGATLRERWRASALRGEEMSITWLENLLKLINKIIANVATVSKDELKNITNINDASGIRLKGVVVKSEKDELARITVMLIKARRDIIQTIINLKKLTKKSGAKFSTDEEKEARAQFGYLADALNDFLTAQNTLSNLEQSAGKNKFVRLYGPLKNIEAEVRQAIAVCEKLKQTQGRLNQILATLR